MTQKGAQKTASPENDDLTDENYIHIKRVCEILFKASGYCLKNMEMHLFRKMYLSH